MKYFEFCDHQDMVKDPTNYFEKKVIKKVMAGIFRNCDRKDIWVEKKVVLDHFKN